MLAAFLSKINIRAVIFVAIALRIIWAFLVPVSPVSDSFLYDVFAQNIAFKHQYALPDGSLTVFWPVGTSAIYALIYSIFGTSFFPLVVFNIAIGAGIVWLTYALCLRYLNRDTALVAAIIVTLWPILIQFTTILASELIFIFLILAALYVWGSYSIPPIFRAIIWGALVCAATFTRPTALPLILILPAIECVSKRNVYASLASLCIAALTATMLFAPWAYRNHQHFGHYVLVSANGGSNLWMGNNPESNGGYMPFPEDIKFRNEVERDIYFKNQAIAFIKNNPLEYLKLAFKRSVITYKAESIGIVWNGSLDKLGKTKLLLLKGFSSLYWWMILALATFGIYRILKDKKIGLLHALIVVAAYFFIFPILTVGQDRYHLPMNPFLAIFAAYTICLSFIERRQL